MRKSIPFLAIGLTLVITSFGVMAEDNDEPAPAAGEPADEPRVGIVSHGPARFGEGLEARFPEQASWLDGEGERFVVLQRRQETPARQGGAVIIPDVGRSPAVGVAGGIRDALPSAGWHSIALTLPELPVAPMPERVLSGREVPDEENASEEEAVAEEDETAQEELADTGDLADGEVRDREMTIEVLRGSVSESELLEAYQEIAMARVDAAVAELRNQGIENIVLIGVGEGADIATRYMRVNETRFAPGGLGLVWINARFRPPLNESLDEILGEGFAIPVLDIHDRHAEQEPASERKVAARRGAFEQYRQAPMPLRRETGTAIQRRVGNRIVGWLESTMRGVER